MARQPNYSFERKERERMQAEKKAKRAAAKEEARLARDEPSDQPSENTDAAADPRNTDEQSDA